MLEAKGICAVRGQRQLFSALSFSAAPGQLWQIEGPNGAGKTTLFRLLAGLRTPDDGCLHYNGQPVAANPDYQRNLLYVGHQNAVKALLTPLENLIQFQRLRGAAIKDPFEALYHVGLHAFADEPACQLSAGQQRRIALAQLWLIEAQIWLLDEPLTALDKQGVAMLLQRIVAHCEQGGLVMLSTHQDLPPGDYHLQRLLLGEVVQCA